MRIGFVTTTYPRYKGDGAGVFISEQVNALRKLGHDVKVIAPEFEGEIHGEPIEDVIRVKFKPHSAMNIAYGDGIWPNLKKNPLLFLSLPGFIKSIERTIRDEFADREVIEAAFTAAGKALLNARRPEQAIVYAGHGSDIHLLESSAMYRKFFGKLLERYDGITVVSEYLADKVTSQFQNIKPVVIPNGVSESVFSYQSDWREKPTAIYASRLIPLKRTDVLASAWAKVVEAIPTAELILFGDGPLTAKCKAIAEEKGITKNVIFRGRVDQSEVWEEMGKGWITVLISEREGFGHGLLESIACGCPFISTPCGAAPDIAEKTDGGTIVEEPLCVNNLAESIIKAFDERDNLKTKGINARKRLIAKYTWNNIASHKDKLYKSLID